VNDPTSENAPTALVIDLDGTLIKTDLLFESLIATIKRQPWTIFLIFIWLRQGLPKVKQELALRAHMNVDSIPVNEKVLAFAQEEKAKGRELALATGSDEHLAQAVADRFGVFDTIIASDGHTNCVAETKAERLAERYGDQNFDYAGNSTKDLAVWQRSRRAIVVGSTRLAKQAQKLAELERVFKTPTFRFRSVLKAMRIHQWTKNLLMLVPLVTAHLLLDFPTLASTLLGFFAFSLVASASYFINDLLDLDADRAHQTKSMRPFASGELSIQHGLIIALGLFVIGYSALLFLPLNFGFTLLLYTALTFCYSIKLKAIPSLDVTALSVLYALRVIAGATLIHVEVSFWLLAFSIFLFFSLAVVKRVSELINTQQQFKAQAKGRGYKTTDINILTTTGTASGFVAVLVFALYINSPAVIELYTTPEYLWPVCILWLFWVTRIWILTSRGEMNEDPIVFAISDSTSYFTFGIMAVLLVLATGQIP